MSCGAFKRRRPSCWVSPRLLQGRDSPPWRCVGLSYASGARIATAAAPTAIPHARPRSRMESTSTTSTPRATAAAITSSTTRRSASRATNTTWARPRLIAFAVWFVPTALCSAALRRSSESEADLIVSDTHELQPLLQRTPWEARFIGNRCLRRSQIPSASISRRWVSHGDPTTIPHSSHHLKGPGDFRSPTSPGVPTYRSGPAEGPRTARPPRRS